MISDFEQMFKNAGVTLNTVILTEGVAELKRQYPLISDNDYHQLIAFDPTYKGGNELGKYGRWILDLYNQFVKDRNNEEKYEKAKAYVAEHPEAKMPPAPVLKSQDRVEDFQKLPDLLKDLEAHLKDIKEPIHNFKSVADLASAVRAASEKDITVDKKAQANYKIFREAMADGLKVVYQDNDWIIGVPETYKSSSHFKDPVTNWCTAYPEQYTGYMENFGGKYYIHLNKHTGELYQLHAESDQFKNRSDKEIDRETFISKYPELKEFYGKIISPNLPYFWVLHNNRPTGDDLIHILKENPNVLKVIPNPSEKEQLTAVSTDGDTIRFIKKPSANVRLAAVKSVGSAIYYISDPTEEECLTAVEQDGTALQYIKNPTEEMCLAAVKNDGAALEYIKSPTEEMCLAAVKNDGAALEYIKSPTEEMCLAAVKNNGQALQFIKNPTKEERAIAIKRSPDAIIYIQNPSVEEQIMAVSRNSSAIIYIKNQSEEAQLVVVKDSPCRISYIANPTEKVQLTAVKEDVYAYNRIKNPTPKVTALYHKLYGE